MINQTELEVLRYPIGRFKKPETLTDKNISEFIKPLSNFPQRLRKETEHLTDEQLNTPYRPEGWTVRQVVHHCADSHINAYTRFKLTLTEDTPTIKPYFETRWAKLPDGKTLPIEPSLKLLEGLHARWANMLKSLSDKELKRTLINPESNITYRLDVMTALYTWHCNHHLAHITELKKRKSWN